MLNFLARFSSLYRRLQDDCDTLEVTLVQERQAAAVRETQLQTTITALTDAMERERTLHDLTRAERDNYQQRFIDKCEYIALRDGKPPFAIVNAAEAQPPATNKRLTRAEIEARQQDEDRQAFLEWLMLHPEEASKYEQ